MYDDDYSTAFFPSLSARRHNRMNGAGAARQAVNLMWSSPAPEWYVFGASEIPHPAAGHDATISIRSTTASTTDVPLRDRKARNWNAVDP